MSAFTARGPALTVSSGQSFSPIVVVRHAWSDALQLIMYSPASLNGGVYVVQISPDDEEPRTWYNTSLGVPVAGGITTPVALAAVMAMRINATTPPGADTTFNFTKQFLVES